MAVLEEKFTALETEVAEVVNILFELLSEEDPVTEAVSLDGQLTRYAQQVERIGLAAEAAGFMALRDLCILFQERLVELGEGVQGLALSEDARLVLEEWPTLVVGYLESPHDPESGEALIQHLQNPAWITPLAEEDAELMKAMLAMQADEGVADGFETEPSQDEPTPVISVTQSEPEPRTDTVETTLFTDEQAPEQTTTDAEATIDPMATLAAEEEKASALETLQEEPSGDSLETLASTPETTEIAPEPSDELEETPIDQTVENTEGVSVAPPLFSDDSQSLSLDESQEQQTMESIISQDDDFDSESEITDGPASLEHVLSAPSVEDAAIDAVDDDSGTTNDTEGVVESDEQEGGVTLASPEAEIALLISILESVPEQATAAETGEYIECYSQQVERIGFAAGVQMPGLQDVCLLFQEALTDLRERGDVLSDMERGLLESWPMLVMSYLGAPTESGTCAALVEFLQSSVWPTPLSQQDAKNLQSVLLPQNTESIEQLEAETETPVLDEDLDTTAPIPEPILEPLLIKPTATTEPLHEQYEESISEEVSAQPVDQAMSVDETETDEEADSSEMDEDEWTDESTEAGAADAGQELVEILCAEIEQMDSAAQETLELAVDPTGDAAARREALTNYAEEVERFTEASEAVGLTGLQQVCAQIHLNLLSLVAEERPITAEESSVLAGWPAVVLGYLQALTDQASGQTLVQYLQDARWPNPLSVEAANALSEALTAPTMAAEVLEVEARQQHAVPDDVSLALPEDVNPELLDSLLQELPSQTAEFSTAIQRLAEGEGNMEDVDVAQRIAHTVKGAGNTVGVRGIANLTHHMEDILLALAKHKKLPTRMMSDTLLNAADCLETMSEALVGISAPPSQALDVLQEVLDWANRIDREGIPTGEEAPPPRKPREEATAPATAPATATAASSVTTEEAPAAEHVATPMLRVPATLVDNLLRLVGESIILTGQIQERINKTMQHSKSVQEQNLAFQQLTAELEQLVDVRGVSSPLAKATAGKGDFDPLELEQYNELNTVTHRLLEVAIDSQEFSHGVEEDLSVLDTLLVDQGRLHRESQEAVLRTRMVPVQTIVPRLQRSVRQTCRLTDKEAELYVAGSDTLIDSNVLNDMTDPLMHVLRNAVDHGIESPEERQARGKHPVGRIELVFIREGNNIVVRCQDDGLGLDLETIRQSAERKGLIKPGKALSEEELSRLILIPGFSTRPDVTQTSGRGIGLDMVYTRIQEIKGSLNIQSKMGQGCLIELRLPVTLISTHAMLVRVRNQLYAISDRGIEQILYSGVGKIRKLGTTTTYQIGDDIYELSTLEELLKLSPDRREGDRSIRPLLLVREESGAIRAVLVEQIVDSRDLVVKSMGPFIPKLRGIVGATILGDGSVAPVLDMPDLLRAPTPSYVSLPDRESVDAASNMAARRRYALVVDDSLSARRALAQFVEDAGFEVRTAKDGMEAAEIIEAKAPDVLLVDLEMPRMNGLELTSHIRTREATHDVPVIMVTSRSTVKHMQEAETVGVNYYVTKPFAEDELLGRINELVGQR